MDLLGRAFGKFLAVIEDENAVAHGGNRFDVVLDIHDGDSAGANLAKQVEHGRGLGVGEAAADFVAEQDFWAGGEGARHLELFLVADREHVSRSFGLILQADRAQNLHGDIGREFMVGGLTAERSADLHVLQHGHGSERAHDLVGARNAFLHETERAQPGHVPAAAHHLAGGRLVRAGDHVEERGLAGAVGADEAEDLSAADFKTNVPDRCQPPKELRQMIYLEYWQPVCLLGGHGAS